MALRLCTSYFKIKKLEEMLFKRSKGTGKVLCRYLPKQCHRSYHKHPQGSRQLNVTSHHQIRSIYIPSVLNAKVVPFKLSDIGEGIVEVTVKEWFIKPGDKIAQFDSICEVQSDKASVLITSRFDGIVKKLHYDVDEMAKVGAPLIDIELDENQDSESDSEEEIESKSSSINQSSGDSGVGHPNQDFRARALATPAVRRIAKENKVDLQQIEGTGKGGRVLKEDILSYLEMGSAKSKIFPIPPPPSPSKPETVRGPVMQSMDQDRKEPITGFRKAMFKTMAAAWLVPHFSYCDEVDVGELVKRKSEFTKIGHANKVKLTFMPFFIKAASLALTKYPELNSHVQEDSDYFIVKASHNIGVAMDTPSGLVVPNIKNVQRLSVVEVARELNRLQDLGAKGQLGMSDLSDGTFTLSNIGAIGGTYTKPLLLLPQVVIGGLGKIQVLPRFDENKNLTEAHLMIISWAADHRILDGATVARFSNLWKAYLAAPQLLLEL